MRSEHLSALRAILIAFCSLQRIQFAAPWRSRQTG
jgi:hypothetical protein